MAEVDEAVEEANERDLVWCRRLFYYLGGEEKNRKNMEHNEDTSEDY